MVILARVCHLNMNTFDYGFLVRKEGQRLELIAGTIRTHSRGFASTRETKVLGAQMGLQILEGHVGYPLFRRA